MNETKTALSTDDIQKKFQEMRLSEKVLLYLKRALAWLAWLGITGGFVLGLTFLFDLSEESCPGLNNISIDLDSSFNTALCYVKLYSTTLTITFANLLLPIIFSIIVTFEEYSPKTLLIVDLTRSIVFRLSGLFVLMIGYIMSNK